MLQALKENERAKIKQRALEIRARELDLFTVNLQTLGGQAALLASFACSALTGVDTSEIDQGIITIRGFKSPAIPAILFTFCCTLALGLNFVCLANCFSVTLLGPGVALRGPDGSMRQAVDAMQAERVDALWYFVAGIVMLHLTVSVAMFIMTNWVAACVVSAMLLVSLWKVATPPFFSRCCCISLHNLRL
jgi:hypothetical protein